jgi:endonuclease/exonuclease/phosphatase family metal-dependent hydrolase
MVVSIPLLFVINGLLLAKGQTPRSGHVVATIPADVHHQTGVVEVLSINAAKGFVYLGCGKLEKKAAVQARLDELAALVRREKPDYLFLSEIVWEAGWNGINQVTYLAKSTGLTNWIFGENFCFGFPGHRVVSGNAILTHHPVLTALDNPDLPGRQPFYITRNNRRMLVGETRIGAETIRLYSLHNDSFVPTNNLAQVERILDHVRGHPAILAGDFNAMPDSPSIQALKNSGLFAGVWSGPSTFQNVNPVRTIDYIFGPAQWEVCEHRVLTNSATDHCAVWTSFQTGLVH